MKTSVGKARGSIGILVGNDIAWERNGQILPYIGVKFVIKYTSVSNRFWQKSLKLKKMKLFRGYYKPFCMYCNFGK